MGVDLHSLHDQIMFVVEALERTTEDYATASTDAARAEAAFKHAHATAVVSFIDSGGKRTVAEREALALLRCRDLHETYLLTRARADAVKTSIGSIRARLDALRTLSADVRALT